MLWKIQDCTLAKTALETCSGVFPFLHYPSSLTDQFLGKMPQLYLRQTLNCLLRWQASAVVLVCCLWGCGSTKSYVATEQLLLSDAVDATVAKLDFSPLAGKLVYLDTTYLKTQKNGTLVDSDYVISSLRQQLVAAGVQLVDTRDDCELIAEARLGALGLDGHSVTYGIPANSALSAASSAIASVPVMPVIPELSFGRHEAKSGAAKIAVFAYDRETHTPYWQSGIARAASDSRDSWLLGIGPWQRGTIYDRTRFAGTAVAGGDLLDSSDRDIRASAAFKAYRRSRLYDAAKSKHAQSPSTEDNAVTTASSQQPVAEPPQ